MANCKTCGAPVNLALDGDPKYQTPSYHLSRGEREVLHKALRASTEIVSSPATIRKEVYLEFAGWLDQEESSEIDNLCMQAADAFARAAAEARRRAEMER